MLNIDKSICIPLKIIDRHGAAVVDAGKPAPAPAANQVLETRLAAAALDKLITDKAKETGLSYDQALAALAQEKPALVAGLRAMYRKA